MVNDTSMSYLAIIIRGLSEKKLDWVSYGQKRDKQIVLSSNMISSEFITVILAFCKH